MEENVCILEQDISCKLLVAFLQEMLSKQNGGGGTPTKQSEYLHNSCWDNSSARVFDTCVEVVYKSPLNLQKVFCDKKHYKDQLWASKFGSF